MITDSPPRGAEWRAESYVPSLEEKAGVSALCKVRLASGPGRSATTPRITLYRLRDLFPLHPLRSSKGVRGETHSVHLNVSCPGKSPNARRQVTDFERLRGSVLTPRASLYALQQRYRGQN